MRNMKHRHISFYQITGKEDPYKGEDGILFPNIDTNRQNERWSFYLKKEKSPHKRPCKQQNPICTNTKKKKNHMKIKQRKHLKE